MVTDKIVGTCEACGSPVTVPAFWPYASKPPRRCRKCGAVPTGGDGGRMPELPAMAAEDRFAVSIVSDPYMAAGFERMELAMGM